MNTTPCQGTNRTGGPCSATPQPGKPWCVWHDPNLAEQRREWNRNAGRAKANSARARKKVLASAMGLSEIDAALCQAMTDVLAGTLEPNVGTAAASIARTIAAVRTTSDLETRLAALEARAEARKQGWTA